MTSWALPFEALYQDGLAALTADTVGFTKLAIDLGPFGGAQAAGPLLWPWALGYLVLVGLVALRGFKRDLDAIPRGALTGTASPLHYDTVQYMMARSIAGRSASFSPAMTREAILAMGVPIALATKGTVRLARGLTSIR